MSFSFRNAVLSAAFTLAAVWAPANSFAELKVAVGSPLPNTGIQLSSEETDRPSFSIDDKMFSELLQQILSEAIAEYQFLQSLLAEEMQNAPQQASFGSKAEYAEALQEWARAVAELQAELDRLEQEINSLIILTTNSDHLTLPLGTGLGNSR
ncbi:hypothetical protein [Roseiconus lacunae]|uniref:Uncharacterized protein n=1 Tax=Roseiconus lacunae TaxID=2605694 RepID=A0ABT7PM40_9BACT|nr:hypothetical protein [Roseiconus lacunae]MDM4017556.1 hypothetical protein [Roseiconus lacunae]